MNSFLLFNALLGLASALPTSNFGLAQNVPPSSSNVKMLGKTKDPNFNTNIYRDGGSSVFANGYHMMIFADTLVDQGTPSPESPLVAHNSLAYFGYDDPTDPTIMHDFGSQTPHTMDSVLEAPVATVPFSNETSEYGIWPSSNMAVLSDGVTVVGMFPMVQFSSSTAVYNTMVTVKVTDPKSLGDSGPTTKRLVNQFFYADEPLFGGLSIVPGPLDGYLYMYASVINGVKLARVQEDDMTDRSKYEYWDGQKFQSKIPKVDDSKANVVQFSTPTGFGANIGPDVGDVFWSSFHKTYLMIFMDGTVNGQFWIAYSPDGSLTSWSTPEKLWSPQPNPTWSEECDASGMGGKWNYAGHSHPSWDTSGKTLLLSWSSCTTYVNMATLTWETHASDSPLAADKVVAPSHASTIAPTSASKPTSKVSSKAASTAASTAVPSSTPTSSPASKLDASSAASSSSTAPTALTSAQLFDHPVGHLLTLGSDGAVHFAAARDAYRLRNRQA